MAQKAFKFANIGQTVNTTLRPITGEESEQKKAKAREEANAEVEEEEGE